MDPVRTERIREWVEPRLRDGAARASDLARTEDGGSVQLAHIAEPLEELGARAAASARAIAEWAEARGDDTIASARAWRREWISPEGQRRVQAGAVRAGLLGRRLLGVALVGGIAIALLMAALIPGVLTLGDAATYTPKPLALKTLSERSTVYAADGSELARLGIQDREPVRYRDVPRVLVDAVVATEDRTFWSNPGIDPGGLLRAFLDDVGSGRVKQGGSTITQQLVKNRVLGPHRDLRRKIQEAILAVRLNQKLSKRQVLTQYLNTVYFGEGAYGVRTAAERFFMTSDPGAIFPRGKRLDELTLPEAALLAGLISDPEGYDPFQHPDQAKARRADVLDRMVAQRYITRVQADLAEQVPLPPARPHADLRPRDLWVDEVQRRLLADPRLGATPHDREQRLLRGGLKIDTTLDPAAQLEAQVAVNTILPAQPPFTGALVAMDPTTGIVRAMVGGPGFGQLQYNIATHPPGRQPGSTYKIITLAAALDAGYSPNDTVNGSSPCTAFRPGFPIWNTQNAEPGGGTMSLRDATVNSVNCAYSHVIASLGPPAVVDMAHRLGIVQPVPAYLPITLGAAEATPLEMATVASTIAAEGVRHDPIFVSRVLGPDGKVIFDDSHPAGRRVLDPNVADCETDILRGVIARGTGTAARLPDRDVAGKTGTTDDHGDAWFIGFTPQLVTAVWMGATTGRVPMDDVGGIKVFGGTYPARIWAAFMQSALAGQPAPPLPAPGPVCDRPGAPISDAGRGVAPGADQGPAPPGAPAPAGPAPRGKHPKG